MLDCSFHHLKCGFLGQVFFSSIITCHDMLHEFWNYEFFHKILFWDQNRKRHNRLFWQKSYLFEKWFVTFFSFSTTSFPSGILIVNRPVGAGREGWGSHGAIALQTGDYAPKSLLVPPDFQTFLRPWYIPQLDILETIKLCCPDDCEENCTF